MEIGAIITVAGGNAENVEETRSASGYAPHRFERYPFCCVDILGEPLLERTLQRLRRLGICRQSVLFEDSEVENLFASRHSSAGKFFFEWEGAVGQHLEQGVRTVLLLRLGAYVEIDFVGLLDFHRETSSPLTQVFGPKSAFDIAAVDANQLRREKGSYRGRLSSLIPYHRRYNFTGYSNPLREPQDFRRLAQDALLGRNSIRPVGEQTSPGVWLGKGCKVDSSARISGPVYIGAHTTVKGSCIINGATTVERDCEVDFGTTVTDSSVLPGTYVGIGLNVVHSVITSNRLFHLNRNVEVEILDRNLLGKKRTGRAFTKLIGERSIFNRRMRELSPHDAHLY